jgi:hypothetical protein
MSTRSGDRAVLEAVAGKRPGPSGWVRGNCPSCETRVGKVDRRQCLGLNVYTARWVCHRCGDGGRIGRMPDEWSDLEAPAPRAIAGPKLPTMDPPDGFFELFDGDGARSRSLDAARQYLTQVRGLSPEVLREARVGACVAGTFAGRVVVPVFGVEPEDTGELPWVGYSTRPWVKNYTGMGYRYPRGMPLATLLYNAAVLQVETDEPVLVVEGVFDAHALWPDAVAALGGTKEGHREQLMSARRPVVLLPDGDAWLKGLYYALQLRFEGQRAGLVHLPPKMDPDEVPVDVLKDAARRSLDAPSGEVRI